mmetsp:Transcript_13667/g.34474  ORF Transcript_13667/g.34474 Transcript_13667/m.34474 type:complete len:300 (+) Transcript_13667:171-1070(+)
MALSLRALTLWAQLAGCCQPHHLALLAADDLSIAVERRVLGFVAVCRLQVRNELAQLPALLSCMARILATHHARLAVRLLGLLAHSDVLPGIGCCHGGLRTEIRVGLPAPLGNVALLATLRARLAPQRAVALVVIFRPTTIATCLIDVAASPTIISITGVSAPLRAPASTITSSTSTSMVVATLSVAASTTTAVAAATATTAVVLLVVETPPAASALDARVSAHVNAAALLLVEPLSHLPGPVHLGVHRVVHELLLCEFDAGAETRLAPGPLDELHVDARYLHNACRLLGDQVLDPGVR